MNESALLTARRGKKIITMREVSESMERVIAGPERKGRVMDDKTIMAEKIILCFFIIPPRSKISFR